MMDVPEKENDWQPSEEKQTQIMWAIEFATLFIVIEMWAFGLVPLPLCIGLCLFTFLVTLALNGWKL